MENNNNYEPNEYLRSLQADYPNISGKINPNIKNQFKIVLLGAVNVGKTSILNSLILGTNPNIVPSQNTLAAYFKTKTIHDNNGMEHKLYIWDTNGEEKYRSLSKMFLRGADAVIIVHDSTDENVENIDHYINEIREICAEDVVIALAENKIDLKDFSNDDSQRSNQNIA